MLLFLIQRDDEASFLLAYLNIPSPLSGCIQSNTASRVLELSDRFLELQGESEVDNPWLVMFYAPWCAYCHRLAPVWGHVAQALHASPVRVARLDCTRFTATATHFKVRAYPTIML